MNKHDFWILNDFFLKREAFFSQSSSIIRRLSEDKIPKSFICVFFFRLYRFLICKQYFQNIDDLTKRFHGL